MMWSDVFFPMHARLMAAGVEWTRAVEIAAAYAWRMIR
jgi:hypothetical protein